MPDFKRSGPEAAKRGKPPSNAQINEAVRNALRTELSRVAFEFNAGRLVLLDLDQMSASADTRDLARKFTSFATAPSTSVETRLPSAASLSWRLLRSPRVPGKSTDQTEGADYHIFLVNYDIGDDESAPPIGVALPDGELHGHQLELALEMIAAMAKDVLGTTEQALTWLDETRVPELGNQTPKELLAEGLGEAVIEYIDELRHGNRG